MRIRHCLALIVLLLTCPVVSIEAMYIRPQLEQVPIERLVENLTKQAEANPTDATIRFNLARVHAMAFAAKTDTAQVFKGRENQGAWFGFEPKFVPFQVQKTDDADKQKAATAQLDAAIADYKKAIELDPNHLASQLGYAWCLEQSGKKDEAIKEYRATIAKGWEKEKNIQAAGLGGHFIVVEAGAYLTPLLDAEKDKDEIAELKERSQKLSRLPRPVTPIAVPLRAGLQAADVEDRAAAVAFDADGTGLPQRRTWIKSNAAWLVYDQRGAGKPESGLQLFGNVTFWCFWDNGYQALSALDNNHDGQLTGAELQHLALWHDANGNGVADPGEVQPLTAYDITALSCRYEIDATHPDRIPFSAAGVTFGNGETRPTWDLILHSK